MAKSIYNEIYQDLKAKIEGNAYTFQSLLPSENEMVNIYHCSRNTIRRALGQLAQEGYVQPVHGKGVFVIYQPSPMASFSVGGIESFEESAAKNGLHTTTRVLQFTQINADERISKKSGFPLGEPLYYIQRLRIIDGRPLILDVNLFSRNCVPGLTREIAETSIYQYIEQTLHMAIVTSKRILTVDPATEMDTKSLELDLQRYNCLAVVTSQTFNSDGQMFEYTQSRHRPDTFRFISIATRTL